MTQQITQSLSMATSETCGGKAAGLRRLIEFGLPVPQGRCLPFENYRQLIRPVLSSIPVDVDLGQVEKASQPVRTSLLNWEPPKLLWNNLIQEISELGWPLVVRSSASCENNDTDSLTSGVFRSVIGIMSPSALLDSIRSCWCSLWEIPAWATLHRQGRWPGQEAMALIIQTQVQACAAGFIQTIDFSSKEHLRIEAVRGPGSALAEGEADPECLLLSRNDNQYHVLSSDFPLPIPALHFLKEAALTVERHLNHAVELEWVFDGTQIWLVQARTLQQLSTETSFPLIWRRPQEREMSWRWDREHNPDPLSPAHSSLIGIVDERQSGPPGYMVQNGYLFFATTSNRHLAELDTDLEHLWEHHRNQTVQHLERFEKNTGQAADPLHRLQSALEFFSTFFNQYFGKLSLARQGCREELQQFFKEMNREISTEQLALLTLSEKHFTLEQAKELYQLSAEVRRNPALTHFLTKPQAQINQAPSPEFGQMLQHYLEQFGSLAPAWDIAVPTFAEIPSILIPRLLALAHSAENPAALHQQQLERAKELAHALVQDLPKEKRAVFHHLLAKAQVARVIEEDDDLYFSRALKVVREALLQAGNTLSRKRWLLQPADIFFLRIPDVIQTLREGHPPMNLMAEVEQQRRLWTANRTLVPPLSIHGDRMVWPHPPTGQVILHGHGIGGVARGPVCLVTNLEEMLTRPVPGAVVVCPTLLPSLAAIMADIAGLVTDHGGLLSHAAWIARELGKVAVVGTGTATRELKPGEMVWVDGSRGLVVKEKIN